MELFQLSDGTLTLSWLWRTIPRYAVSGYITSKEKVLNPRDEHVLSKIPTAISSKAPYQGFLQYGHSSLSDPPIPGVFPHPLQPQYEVNLRFRSNGAQSAL
jgi:hypothetical protein